MTPTCFIENEFECDVSAFCEVEGQTDTRPQSLEEKSPDRWRSDVNIVCLMFLKHLTPVKVQLRAGIWLFFSIWKSSHHCLYGFWRWWTHQFDSGTHYWQLKCFPFVLRKTTVCPICVKMGFTFLDLSWKKNTSRYMTKSIIVVCLYVEFKARHVFRNGNTTWFN